MLHQVRTSNNDSQILAHWATKKLNNITLFKVGVKEGLDLQWHGEAGIGPAYTTRAYGPNERTPLKLDRSKRAATLVELSPRKKFITAAGEPDALPSKPTPAEEWDFLEEPVVSLASEEVFPSHSLTRSFLLGRGDGNTDGSQENERIWKWEARRRATRRVNVNRNQ